MSPFGLCFGGGERIQSAIARRNVTQMKHAPATIPLATRSHLLRARIEIHAPKMAMINAPNGNNGFNVNDKSFPEQFFLPRRNRRGFLATSRWAADDR